MTSGAIGQVASPQPVLPSVRRTRSSTDSTARAYTVRQGGEK